MKRFTWYLCLLGAISPLSCFAQSTEESLFLRRIADFWQEGEYNIAKSQIEEFITIYPDSSYTDTLCAALGDLLLREKDPSGALHYYANIQTSEIADRVFSHRMQCLYEMQWYASLADECETFLEKKTDQKVTYFLAIALYNQCLNLAKEPEKCLDMAKRAKPHFETLSKRDLSDEVAQGFAHLCCILKEFSIASQIYLELANNNPDNKEDMLFQAALTQSEYDKELALQSFKEVVSMDKSRAKEALYNQFILLFESGKYEELTKMPISEFPPDKLEIAHLFLGRSFLQLRKYDKAITELQIYLQNGPAPENTRSTILTLIDASYRCSDLTTLEQAITRLNDLDLEDEELPKAYFTRAKVLKNLQNIPEARSQLEELLSRFPNFTQNSQALFELVHLDYLARSWKSCNQRARLLLNGSPEQELALFAWRYLISSSAEIALNDSNFKEQLIADLEAIKGTHLNPAFSDGEKNEWLFLLAQTNFELDRYENAMQVLQNLNSPNATLLLALCYNLGPQDKVQFCQLAEVALSQGADLVEVEDLHKTLFNTYLELGKQDQAIDHLYAAFQKKGDLQLDNLLYLAENFYTKLQAGELSLAKKAIELLEHLKNSLQDHGEEMQEVHCKLARAYSIQNRVEEAIILLESIEEPGEEVELLLAENYVKQGLVEKAASLFDHIIAVHATLKSPLSASACLQRARLKQAQPNPNVVEIATQLKNLKIQKTIGNEPIHLEAALEYIDLMTNADFEKRMSLLRKTKADFENADDLLSKDYHLARSQLPSQDQIYQDYMKFFDAEILLTQAKIEPQNQNKLREQAKEILLTLAEESSTHPLLERARMLLANLE